MMKSILYFVLDFVGFAVILILFQFILEDICSKQGFETMVIAGFSSVIAVCFLYFVKLNRKIK